MELQTEGVELPLARTHHHSNYRLVPAAERCCLDPNQKPAVSKGVPLGVGSPGTGTQALTVWRFSFHCNQVLSGEQPRQCGVAAQFLGDCLHLHH
jgi:hypothetical protein